MQRAQLLTPDNLLQLDADSANQLLAGKTHCLLLLSVTGQGAGFGGACSSTLTPTLQTRSHAACPPCFQQTKKHSLMLLLLPPRLVLLPLHTGTIVVMMLLQPWPTQKHLRQPLLLLLLVV
jgi:hypothetical protein